MHNTSTKRINATTKDERVFFRPYLFCSEKLTDTLSSSLSAEFELRLLPAFASLDAPVACHADMLIFRHRDTLVLHRDYFNANSTLFEGVGCNILLADESASPKYPNDILLNALPLGGILYANKDHISHKITSLFETVIKVKQGYTACSYCKVTENALITADRGIADAVRAMGADVLLIEPGHIVLDGYDSGFIGGASFTFGESVFFFGDLNTHPDCSIIKSFIESHGKMAVSLSSDTLTDLGGAVVLPRSDSLKT